MERQVVAANQRHSQGNQTPFLQVEFFNMLSLPTQLDLFFGWLEFKDVI